jgi:O-antigen ligase
MRAPAKTHAPAGTLSGLSRIIFWLFIAALAWTPFWFGSNTFLAWGLNAAIFPGLAVLHEAGLLIARRPHPVGVRWIAAPATLIAAVICWIVFQNATWTPPALHHPIWAMASDVLGRPLDGSISVNRDLTALALMRLLTAASVFWLALQFGRDAARANTLILALAAICTVYCVYGLVAFGLTPGTVLWTENPYMRGFVTATFYNRNNFATYAGIGFVLLSGMILRLYGDGLTVDGAARRIKIAAFIQITGERGAIPIGAAFIVFVAMLLSGSRGAIVAAGIGLFTLLALMLRDSRIRVVDRRATVAVVVFAIAAATLIYGEILIGKVAQQGFSDASRIAIYQITLGSILDSPLTGYGYGTFKDIFPMFRDRSVTPAGIWEMAHNSYLEIFQGLGLIAGFMLIGAVGLLALTCLKGALKRRTGAAIPAIATAVSVLLAAKAFVDFSLQIQAVTLTFMAILGTGVAQSMSSRLTTHD